jgi:hypothetical protein
MMNPYTRIGWGGGIRSINSIGDRLETRRMESTETRIILRIIVYCLKILTRWLQ